MTLFLSLWSIISLSMILIFLQLLRHGLIKQHIKESPEMLNNEDWFFITLYSILVPIGIFFLLSEVHWNNISSWLEPKLNFLVKEHEIKR